MEIFDRSMCINFFSDIVDFMANDQLQGKANKGSAGIDGVNFEIFEKKLNNNLYRIWDRMSSGSCFPSPVLAVEILKKAGGTRRLGIPTILDRIAQMVARMYVEPMFSEDSYGYRPNKSVIDAIESTRKRCWRYDYVIELDVKGLFDNIDHELLMRVVERHVKEKWICLYVKRWLETPICNKGRIENRKNIWNTTRWSDKSSTSKYVLTLCI